ncbi:hypothetical protein L873DRAFT_1812765, partial [Choiromyces venosus 120613-1]
TILQNLSDIHQSPPLRPIIAIRVEIIATSAEAEIKGFTLGSRGDYGHPPGWRICGSG